MFKGSHVLLIGTGREARKVLQDIGVDPRAYEYMTPKMLHYCVKFKALLSCEAIIIKQEMLSRGGDAAVNKEVLTGRTGKTDLLLMGTAKQYGLLAEKLKRQPGNLPAIAAELESVLSLLEFKERTIKLAGGRELPLRGKTLIMGILNVTPDSFFDRGRFFSPGLAIDHAGRMLEQGADIIDVGGASSRPGSVSIDAKEELERILPVVKILAEIKGIVISVDTYRAEVARACLEAGAHMINDIGGLQLDADLGTVVAEHRAGIVLMHNRLQRRHGELYQDLIADIAAELDDFIKQANTCGIKDEQIIVDPGIGFGKTPKQSLKLLKNWESFKGWGLPTLLGASRKSFIGQNLNLEVTQRLEGSLAVLAWGVMNGADIVRVHDVEASVRTIRMLEAIMDEEIL